MEENNTFDIHVTPIVKIFYAEATSWGTFKVKVNNDSPNQEKIKEIDYFRDITIVGNMPYLENGKIYVANVSEVKHPKFGLQYQVKTVYQKAFSTRDEQITFLGAIITSIQLEKLISAYPHEDLLDLIKNDKIELDLVNGIGEKTLEKIKDKISENEKYQLAIVELTGKYNIPFKAIKRLTDKYGSPDLLIQKINQNPYILTEIDGFGFKKVDEIALKMGVEKTSSNRIKSCIEYVLDEHANNGHSWVKKTKAISDSIKLLGIKISDVQEVLNNVDKSDVFLVNEERIYLVKYLAYELGVSQHIKRLLESDAGYSVDKVEELINSIEGKQGFEFTTEQRMAIYFAIENNVIVVNGKAGTGKTSVIKGIVEVLKSVPDLSYATCALSGKASLRIQESTGLLSATIHRTLGFNPYDGWVYNEDNPLSYDIIIIDEASMVNSELFHYLFRAIKDGAKLIITGDTAQLEPIGVGNILVDILDSDYVPSVELTIVHRQAQKSGILSCANMVRDGIKFLKNNDYGVKRLGELQDLYMYSYDNSDRVLKTVLNLAKNYNEDIMDFQVLAPMKTRGSLCTKSLNTELQLIFNKDPQDVDKKRKIERKDSTILEGDKVIINGNNYTKNVFNGTMGIIEFIDTEKQDGEIVINFEGVGNIQFKKEEMNQIDLGYAISIHKSQGSQWKYVVLAIDYASYILLNRQSTYTAMTRAVSALFMVVELKALQYSIDTDKSSQRNTFLNELLPKVA